MTPVDSLATIDESTLIDRILDGVLSPAELRTAITRLDQSPGAWKRCSLAFIEAQSWQQAFDAMSPAEKQEIVLLAPRQDATRPRIRIRRLMQTARAAAIAAVALTIGWLSRDLARNEAEKNPSRQPFLSVSLGDSQFIPIEGLLEETTVPLPASIVVSDSPTDDRKNQPIQTIGQLWLAAGTDVAQVPILSGPGLNNAWLRNQPPAVPKEQQDLYQRQGYEIQQRRRIVTATLADGRRITVPIDDVQIRRGEKTSL